MLQVASVPEDRDLDPREGQVRAMEEVKELQLQEVELWGQEFELFNEANAEN